MLIVDIIVSDGSGNGVVLNVFVKPKSGRSEIFFDENEGVIVVFLKSPPTGGKANKELVKILSKTFGLSSSKIKIVKGLKSREKQVLIEEDLTFSEVLERLKSQR